MNPNNDALCRQALLVLLMQGEEWDANAVNRYLVEAGLPVREFHLLRRGLIYYVGWGVCRMTRKGKELLA